MELITAAFIFSVSVNLLMFLPAFKYKTDKLTDISYAVTFALVALFSYYRSEMNAIHYFIFAAVFLWAARLGSFLFMRINHMKKDKRFDGMREKFWSFLRFWVLQGITVPVVLIPALFVFSKQDLAITTVTWLGLGIAMTGLVLEAFADQQKFEFGKKKKNKGHWIDEGVWKISRHPNYLGEISMWTGVYIASFPVLTSFEKVVALVSPLFIMGLLLFVSGIPMLEKSADKKWGNKKEYKQYKKEVPVLVPTPSSIKRLFSN